MPPEVELQQAVEMLLVEAEKLAPLLETQRMIALANALSKIERLARVGGYCIIDIADMA
jgi:hypothetical protein